jgi:hypothetical protein
MKESERREKEMTRKIKFKGKAKMSIEELNELGLKHENGWVYGHLVMYGKTPYIVGDFIEVTSEYTVNEFWVEVIPDTVGQFTGFKDKNKKEMYEGDIANLASEDTEPFMRNIPLVVRRYPDGQFLLVDRLGCRDFLITNIVEVIGNIHDNPELLEVK